MKGPSRSTALRIRVVTIFAAAFTAGSLVIFGTAYLVGAAAFRVVSLPSEWRVSCAAVILIALAFVDLLTIKKGRYCLLGWRRQTPKTLGRRYAVLTVVAAWGFDTGLAVTTFRVAAITWGALVMAGLGLSSWLIGFGYGLGFLLPLLISILTQPSDAGSGSQSSVGLRLQGLLGKRVVVQCVSAVVLFVAGAILLLGLFE